MSDITSSSLPMPYEAIIIERPNELKEKVGGSLDASLANRAEQAVQLMAKDFRNWLEDMIAVLSEARAALDNKALTKDETRNLYARALEVKSLGETYGYALITRFAHSLCRLLIRLEGDKTVPAPLLDAHIDAIKAAMRADMKAVDHPVGGVLASELEKQVAAFYQTT